VARYRDRELMPRTSVLRLACWLAAGLACSGAATAPRRDAAGARGDPATFRGRGVDAEAVRSVIRGHVDDVRRCYEAYLLAHPQAAGQLTLTWIIGADGGVRDPSFVREKTTLPGDEVPACVVERVRAWQFPRARDGGDAVVTYPWILRPSSAAPSAAPQ
jgi:hypothetical protein